MNTPEKIIKLREQKGWSQRELASRVDLDPSVMNRIEVGKRPVKDNELKKLADVLGVTTDYLVGRSQMGDESVEEEALRLINDPEFMVAYKKMPGTPEETREDLIEFMKMVIKQDRRKRKK